MVAAGPAAPFPLRYLAAGDGAHGTDRFVDYEVTANEGMGARELLGEVIPSRREAGRILARGQLVRDDGAPLSAGDRLAPGDRVRLWLVREDDVPVGAGSDRKGAGGREGLRLLYRDPFLMAVDKPAGVLVHGDGSGARTLTDMASEELAREGVPARPQAVQRLDVETTGVVVLSLAEEFQPALDALVAGRGMRKRYLAVVRGSFPPGRRDIDLPIGRDRHDARRMRVGRGGKPALTHAELLCARGGYSLLALELGTGRRHQIRVHLAHLGFPIVGDGLYGRPGRDVRGGLMLHASSEEFRHPATGEDVRVESPWPVRFDAFFSPADAGGRVHTRGD